MDAACRTPDVCMPLRSSADIDVQPENISDMLVRAGVRVCEPFRVKAVICEQLRNMPSKVFNAVMSTPARSNDDMTLCSNICDIVFIVAAAGFDAGHVTDVNERHG